MLDVRKFPLISDQVDYKELTVIVRELTRVLIANIPGAVVELGCYTGTTSLFIQRVLTTTDRRQPRGFHVYDSFSGLPEKDPLDASPAGTQFVAGQLRATKATLIRNFKQANLPVPVIHAGWFEQLSAEDLPKHIAFAFLDGDFYSSILSSLDVITPQLSPNATILVDDYQSEALPGTRRAVDQWATRYGLQIRTEQSLALIRWPPA